ncbi:MAG TPA: hypothetical protein ENJ89_11095 [Caldithrix abyssi]|uniref:SatD n=1 Tax=Caldithrix abyssi TaxID=187145 RepID=A0A7V5PR76_CALAY|nr:hypothetical protein [Caldithrix abyssi]
MSLFAVINADIVASRRMAGRERHEGQLFLKSALIQLNETFAADIEAPFMITKGDEFQGVLRTFSVVHAVMDKIEQMIYPVDLRFGVGYGQVYRLGSDITIEMDGPAFHRANEALKLAKKKKYSVCFQTNLTEFDDTVNTIYLLIQAIKRGWSDLNYKRYWRYKDLGTLRQVAEKEGVSTQAVWESLHQSGALDVMKADQAIHRMLQHFELNYADR